MRFTKKLDFNPSCLFAYHVSASEESPGVVRTLISSHSNQLLVLQDSTLIWAAAMMGNIPVQLTTANFQLVPFNVSCQCFEVSVLQGPEWHYCESE